MKDNNIHILIAKFLSGESAIDEINFLEEWRNLSPKNEQMFQVYCETWEIAHASSVAAMIPDKKTVWHKILMRMEQQSAPVMYSRHFLFRTVGIAASLMLLVGLSLSLFLFTEKPVEGDVVTIKTPYGQKSEVVLPDGSSVWLNGGSLLSYVAKPQKNDCEVSLVGEAFFDVVRSSGRTFRVNAGGIQVQVHGTAFNVNAYQEKDVEVALLRGHITVHDPQSDRLLADLSPGNKMRIANQTQEIILAACDTELESLWRHGMLKIEGEPMERIVEKLERWYGVNITLKGKKIDEYYWITVKTESLTEALTLISKTTPVNFRINGEEVVIEYK